MESNENVLEAMAILDSAVDLMDLHNSGDLPIGVDMDILTRALISQARSKLESAT